MYQCRATLQQRSKNSNIRLRPRNNMHHTHGTAPSTMPTYNMQPLDDNSSLLPPTTINQFEQIVGTFLYYGLAVDPTMLVALGDLSSQQTKYTAKTYDKVIWSLNYTATHPDAIIRYHSSGMILHFHSDASYLSDPRARSSAARHCILTDPFNDATTLPKSNSPIHSVSKIMENVMGSAAEDEIGAA